MYFACEPWLEHLTEFDLKVLSSILSGCSLLEDTPLLVLQLLFLALEFRVDTLLILAWYGYLLLGTMAWSIHLLFIFRGGMALPTCVSLLWMCPSRRFHLLFVIILHEVLRIGSRMQIYF